MTRNHLTAPAALLLLAATSTALQAQADHHGHLHVSTRWKDCSFQIDPALTQDAWRQFTAEVGLVTYFRPLTTARPMGAGKFEIVALQWATGFDDESPAWNHTFVHPESDHPLKHGKRLPFPGVSLRAGVTERLDAGVYFTQNFSANYGVYGGQLQYNLVNDRTRKWAAATRASFSSLFGPEDLTLTVVGAEVVASREFRTLADWASVSPYAGASAYLSSAHERTDAVQLRDEHVGGLQAMIGAEARLSRFTIGAEYNVGRVRTQSVKIGMRL